MKPKTGTSWLIEFFGLPGVGKTTIADSIAAWPNQARRVLTRRDITEHYMSISLTAKLLALLRSDPRILRIAYAATHWPRHDVPLSRRLGRASQTAEYFLAAKNAQNHNAVATIILDQWLASFLARRLQRKSISPESAATTARLFVSMFQPIYVHVTAEVNVVVDRLYSRGIARQGGAGDGWLSPLDSMSKREIAEYIEGREGASLLMEETLRSVGADVITLDGNRPVDEVCKELIASLTVRNVLSSV